MTPAEFMQVARGEAIADEDIPKLIQDCRDARLLPLPSPDLIAKVRLLSPRQRRLIDELFRQLGV